VLALCGSARATTFGANVGGLFTPGHDLYKGFVALQALRATGATVARADTDWTASEPQPPTGGVHDYDWSHDDVVAGELAEAGLRWDPVFDYAPWWAADAGATTNAGVSPDHIGDYAAYASAFAARYGLGGSFWASHPTLPALPVTVYEIWNEPDLDWFWQPAVNLSEYASTYQSARAAIRSTAPQATVIIGGLVSPMQSLPSLLADDRSLMGNVDGIAVHSYRPGPDSELGATDNDLREDQSTFGVPLYVNEYGWKVDPAGRGGVTEAQRDAGIEQFTAQLGSNPWVADLEPFCWSGCGTWDLYGTPGAAAFAQGIAAAQLASTPVASQAGSGSSSTVSGSLETALRAAAQSVSGLLTGEASAVTATAATLVGEIGRPAPRAAYFFQYGPAPRYGSQSPPRDVPSHPAVVSDRVRGLRPSTTYHFRLVMDTPTGMRYGADQTFRSLPRLWGLRLAPLRGGPRKSAQLDYRVSERATLIVGVERLRMGLRIRGRCVRARASTLLPRGRASGSRRAPCRIYELMKARVTHRSAPGAGTLTLGRRLWVEIRGPGKFRLVAVARTARGLLSAPVSLPLARF
jgi:hypothetical protein